MKAKEITLFCHNTPVEFTPSFDLTESKSNYIGIDTSLFVSRYLRSVFRPPALIV
ncbi:MAG: hypothetical protein PHD73_07900 [Sediminibacterium sp.]|nr:hypothetical protein [Sediminibacterium sp.]